MNFRKSNLDSLRKEGYYLYRYLESDKDFSNWRDNNDFFLDSIIDTEKSKDQQLITLIKQDDRNVRLNSSYYPLQEANIWAKQFSTKVVGRAHRIIYLFGLSNGYYVKELLKIIEKNETVIIYEPMKEMFLYAMDNFDLMEIITNPNVFIFVEGINSTQLKDFVEQSGTTMVYGDGTFINLPYYDQLFKNMYEWFKELYTQKWITAMVDRNTAIAFGKEWANATVDNLACALESDTIEGYRGIIPQDIPVIVVAAGPSLELNVDVLKKAKDRAVILAVDTSLSCLYEHGIEPDFAVTLDVHKPMFLFDNPLGKTVPMMVSISGNPSVIEYSEGKKVFFDYTNFLGKVKYDTNNYAGISPSGSVATATFEIARYMGAKTIILVGQDLAYKGDKSHVLGLELYKNHDKFTSVEGNNGEQLWTRHDWFSFLLWFEKEIPHYEGIVVNATEGGAKIQGTQIMTLEESIDKYCLGNIDTKKLFDNISDFNVNKKETYKIIESLLKQLSDVIALSKEAIEQCDYLIRENERVYEESYAAKNKVKRLSQINAKINSYDVNELITLYIYEVFIDEYQTLFSRFDEERKNRLNVYKKARIVYEAVYKASEDLSKSIEKQKEKHSRKE